MNIQDLIDELQSIKKYHKGDGEIGYKVGKNSIDLLIGSDEKTGESIIIPKQDW